MSYKGFGYEPTPKLQKTISNKMLVLKKSHFIQYYDLYSSELGNGSEEAREQVKYLIETFLDARPEADFQDFILTLLDFSVSQGKITEEEAKALFD